MPVDSKEIIRTKLIGMLDECNEEASQYKALRAKGLNKDDTFEAVNAAKKQVITNILDFIK